MYFAFLSLVEGWVGTLKPSGERKEMKESVKLRPWVLGIAEEGHLHLSSVLWLILYFLMAC